MRKSAIISMLCGALGLLASEMAGAAVHPLLESALKCSDEAGISPAVGAYALLESSTIVVREVRGPLTLYLGAFEQNARGAPSIFKMTPNRLLVVSRRGMPIAAVGALFPAVAQMSDEQILGSYKGGLGRDIQLEPIQGSLLASAGVISAGISREPVAKSVHLLLGRLSNGERIALCAPKKILLNYVR